MACDELPATCSGPAFDMSSGRMSLVEGSQVEIWVLVFGSFIINQKRNFGNVGSRKEQDARRIRTNAAPRNTVGTACDELS